jgi:hypothetical protein
MNLKANIKFKLPNFRNFKPRKLLKFLPLTTLVLLVGVLVLTLQFLYHYFYETIAEVKVVSILRSQVALNQVNLPLYQKVLDAWEAKKKFDPTALAGLKDPFLPLPPTPAEGGATLEDVNSTQ